MQVTMEFSLIKAKITVFESICDSRKASVMVFASGGGFIMTTGPRLKHMKAKSARKSSENETVPLWWCVHQGESLSVSDWPRLLLCSLCLRRRPPLPHPAPTAPPPASVHAQISSSAVSLHRTEASSQVSTESNFSIGPAPVLSKICC